MKFGWYGNNACNHITLEHHAHQDYLQKRKARRKGGVKVKSSVSPAKIFATPARAARRAAEET